MAVFICYRRDDAEGEARALCTRLAEETDSGNIFLDHDAIGAGEDWHVKIDQTLKKVGAVLVVIGPRWFEILQQRAKDGRPDTVRLEIVASLAQKNARIIPVLVKGASLPPAQALPEDMRTLADHNAIEVRGGAWTDDTARLVKTLRKFGALPTQRRRWLYRSLAAVAVLAVGGAAYAMRVQVPAIPAAMTKPYVQQLVEARGLRVSEHTVGRGQIGAFTLDAAKRGIPVAVAQRPAPGQVLIRNQTVEVDFMLVEPYWLVCKGGGALSSPNTGDTIPFEKYAAAWSMDITPGACAWVTGAVVPNQMPFLKPVGFKDQLPELFKNAPGNMLAFCAMSEYEHAGGGISEHLLLMKYKQFLTPDDSGKLNPTISGYVCDDRL